ncbi:283_t:CDS:2, partial [Gigaspora margarita]
VIAALLHANTHFTLAPTLPSDFEENIFDHHFETPAISTLLLGTDEEIDYRISSTTRSMYTLEPEDLDNLARPSHTFSLLPYDENTTQV